MSTASALGFVGDCLTGKRRFPTEAEAVAFLRRPGLRALGSKPKVPTRAYECPACGGWHLTAKPRGRRARW